MRRFIAVLTTVMLVSVSAVAMAQENGAGDTDYAAKRRALAEEMHKIRPAREQVDEAIEQVARNLPEGERERFLNMVEDAFDYAALEKKSIDTMVDLFTVVELQAMVDYFGSDEAQSIARKLPKYQDVMQPEIIRSLDKALADDRFGGSAPLMPGDVSTPEQ